jgi:hypothetical protein
MVHNEIIKPKLIFGPTGQKQPQFYVKFNPTVNIRFPKKKNLIAHEHVRPTNQSKEQTTSGSGNGHTVS